MWNFIVIVVVVLFCLLGLVAGLEIGSSVLEKSTLVRPGDWMECMVGYPVIGGIVFALGWFVKGLIDFYRAPDTEEGKFHSEEPWEDEW